MSTSHVEKDIGIEGFASTHLGIGGSIKHSPEDFTVEELLLDGSRVKSTYDPPSRSEEKDRYLICLLVKQDWDTITAIHIIARQLGIHEERIQAMGLKDKRAVTAQYISIENIKMIELKRITTKGLTVQPLRYSPNMMFPQMLYGNAFKIVIRQIPLSHSAITNRMNAMLDSLRSLGGFPNFFGHQRFGVTRPITHKVGRALAEGDLKQAVLVFLANYSAWEHPQARLARIRLSESSDFKTALEEFPKNLAYERLLLSYLQKHPEDFTGALRELPIQLRRLFLQAYQSYLFNRFLSERAKRGIPIEKPQKGDYVLKADSNRLPSRSYVKATSRNLETLRRSVKKGEMFVALPLIGFRQSPSDGLQGEIEASVLQRENITQQHFLTPSLPEVSAGGGLRATVARVQNLSFEMPMNDEQNPAKRKLGLGFTLHRGCYATVFLRELMKPHNLAEAGF
ncbi:MAG: tRNA pseudouridine(13) synthase TruD [Candidatus Bathyarchaeota archaeon]|nr:MAG: tRNA pseudouridine(13) synthase TruD [Candidatus Bathyarchaeota archaeon]